MKIKRRRDRDNLLATFFLVRRELDFCALLRQLSHVAPVEFLVQLLLEPRVVGIFLIVRCDDA